MELGLRGKVVGITGGADGIGLATAHEMAAEGCRLMLCDVNDANLQEAASRLSRSGATVFARRVDVTRPDEVSSFVADGQARFGTIDVWINNAGVYPQRPLMEMPLDEWNRLLAVNMSSVLTCTQVVGRVMRQATSGVVINAASFAGLVPSAGSGAYAATKAAILSLTRSFAAELAVYGIRVVAYVPGVIETPMTKGVVDERRDALVSQVPLRRLGKPADVAKAIVFLASDAASYITGTHLEITGGKLCVQNPEAPWLKVRDGASPTLPA